MQFITSILIVFLTPLAMSVSNAAEVPDYYTHKVQPIFDARCLSCHSCFNAPCQLNLQNYEGFARGANKLQVYDGMRSQSVEPTRLWIDAKTPQEWWTQKQFFSLNASRVPAENLFFLSIAMKQGHLTKVPEKQVGETRMCPGNLEEQKNQVKTAPEMGMPYGLPALTVQEQKTLEEWISKGAPGPSAETQKKLAEVPGAIDKQIRQWEKFLNQQDLPQRLVSRYMYEHLFLAHVYFPEDPSMFFRLVRSASQCDKGVDEIATRRPNDDPGRSLFHYCFLKFPGTVVAKTHLPLEFSPAKLERYKKIFYETPWKIVELPSYAQTVAENPFVAFQGIPVKARYQFLLEDSMYQVATFIKGPVCNGSNAVNSIQEQFYVFFLQPSSDNMVISKSYADLAKNFLIMPGMWGSDVTLKDAVPFAKELVDHREKYRQIRAKEAKRVRPKGYALKDLWNGDGKNDNAVLTVFRHDDNAVVMKGAVGDLPKTGFVMDYPLMERLVYNLVVNFDVFGNLGHQMLTRVYMDMIRMEAEELFLYFLPPEQRLLLRREWYRGFLTEAKMSYVFPTVASDMPTAIRYNNDSKAKSEFIHKVLFYRQNEKTRGKLDALNWKNVDVSSGLKKNMKLDAVESELRKVASVKANGNTPFARFFSEFSYLLVKNEQGDTRVFSMILNREHENISWILGESLRLAPAENSLTIQEGFWGAYPVQFFAVDEKNLKAFVKSIQETKSGEAYKKLVSDYGVHRMSPQFWPVYDELNASFKKQNAVDFGYLDLTRYSLQ
ncbi:Fatty acid cis/trans isomerase (CTI) [compost metagenome]